MISLGARLIALLSASLLVVVQLSTAPVASGEQYFPAETKYWVDCSLGFRSTDCIESIEFADPSSAKRDSDGRLDYASLTWKRAKVTSNSKFSYKGAIDTSGWKPEDFSRPCEGAFNGDYLPDACYTAEGLLPDGSDLIFHVMANGQRETFEIYQWVDTGVERTWERNDGWKATTVPDGSTWRITIKSNTLAKNAGTLTANMKNPLITFSTGSDGISRTVIQGSVYPNQHGCQVPGRPFDPAADPRVTCALADTFAETASTGFSIYLSPYIYQFEKLKGYPAGGIFVTGPTGSLGQVQYDQEQGQITVPMYGPHYLFDRKTLNKGWMEVSIKGEVIRRAFNLEPSHAGQVAKVEISYAQGQSDVATYNSRYLKELDVFEIRAYNFGFSSPTLSVKMPPAKKSGANATQNKGSNRASITCTKGKAQKVVTGKAPKCPRGYSIKR